MDIHVYAVYGDNHKKGGKEIMVGLTRQDKNSGLLVKHYPNFVRWKGASLREAWLDFEGYYLKVDGELEDEGTMEQLYLFLSSSDIALAIAGWIKAILSEGSEWAKFCLGSELSSVGLKIKVLEK